MKDLSLHILDIAQNSIVAGAGLIRLEIIESLKGNTLSITVEDNGRGIPEEMVGLVKDPYVTSRTTRKVGMGIPLFRHTAVQAGGDLDISSTTGKGTILKAWMQHNHIDRPVIGDIAGVVAMLSGANPDIDFVYKHITDIGSFEYDTREARKMLDNVPLSDPGVIRFVKEMIREQLADIAEKIEN